MAEPAQGVPVYDPATGGLRMEQPQEAAAQIKTGQVRPQMGKVSIVRDNEVREIDPAKLAEAESYGWALVDSTGVRAARIREEEDTLLGNVRGSAEAAASGLTFGLSDLAAAELGADPERMRARQEGIGDLGDALRLAGEVVPVALSGGTAAGARTAVGRTVSRLGVAPRAVEAAGLALEGGARRVLGQGVAGRAAGAFARGAVEGAAGAAGQEIHESVLGEREITAERLLASGGMGALFGGAASAAFPLTGSLLKRGAKAPADAAAEVLAKATKGDPSNVRPVAEMLGAASQGKPTGPTRKILGEMRTKEGRSLVNEVAHDLEGATARSASLVKEATASMAERVKRVVGDTEAGRAESMRGMLGDVDGGVAQQHIQRSLMGAYEEVMGPNGLARVKQYQGNGPMLAYRLDDAAGVIEEAFDDVARMTDAADMHTRMLKAKRRLQEIAKDTSAADDVGKQTRRFIQDRVRSLDAALESDVFGKAGGAYKTVKEADRLALQSSEDLFRVDRNGQRKGRNIMGRILLGEATDAEVTTFARRIGNPKYADQMDVADDYFQRQIKASEVRAEVLGDQAAKREAAALRKDYEGFKKTMSQQAKVADIADAFKAAGRGGLAGPLAIFGPSGATVVGGVLGGLPGAAVGGAINAMARPGSTLRTLAAVSHLADKAGVDVTGIVDRAMSLDAKGAAKAAAGAAGRGARKAAKAAGRAAAPARGVASRVAGRAGASLSRNDDQRAKQRRASELADPDTLTKELAQEMYALADAAPGIAGVAAEKVGIAAKFLESKLPPELNDPVTGRRRIVDPGTRESFDRYYEAVTDPIAALRRLESGTMTLEHAEALREVWPALYRDVQEKTLMRLQEAADEGKKIPYSRRKSLGVLLGIPTVPEMAPEYIVATQALMGPEASAVQNASEEAQQADAQTKRPRTRKTTFDSTEGYDTTLSRIERRPS